MHLLLYSGTVAGAAWRRFIPSPDYTPSSTSVPDGILALAHQSRQAVLEGANAVFPQLAGVGTWMLAGHSMVRRV